MSEKVTRKLTTILAADAENFSAAMDVDEVGTFTELHASRDVFQKLIDRHGGRIANTAGDGLIAEFPSVVEAVQCAIEAQQELSARKEGLQFRIGVHLGDVIVDGQDLIGEGVNLAARLQTMAEPGGVLISQQVYDQVHAKLSIGFEFLGEKRPKNLTEDVAVYRVSTQPVTATPPRPSRQKAPRPSPRPNPRQESEPVQELTADALGGVLRNMGRSLQLGLLFMAALLAIDLFTGPGFWVHWPILAFGTATAMALAPQLAPFTPFSPSMLRAFIPMIALLLVNLFSWSGTFWAIWPIGVWVFVFLGNRIRSSGN